MISPGWGEGLEGKFYSSSLPGGTSAISTYSDVCTKKPHAKGPHIYWMADWRVASALTVLLRLSWEWEDVI